MDFWRLFDSKIGLIDCKPAPLHESMAVMNQIAASFLSGKTPSTSFQADIQIFRYSVSKAAEHGNNEAKAALRQIQRQ